jgi:hypothetical protein
MNRLPSERELLIVNAVLLTLILVGCVLKYVIPEWQAMP